MTDTKLIENMTKDQFRDYWRELKQARFDSHYFREMFDKVRKMNPHVVMPDDEVIERIKADALSVAFWEENWEQMNEKRVRQGGINYSIFFREVPNETFRIDMPRSSQAS